MTRELCSLLIGYIAAAHLHLQCGTCDTDILHVLSSEPMWDDRDVQLVS